MQVRTRDVAAAAARLLWRPCALRRGTALTAVFALLAGLLVAVSATPAQAAPGAPAAAPQAASQPAADAAGTSSEPQLRSEPNVVVVVARGRARARLEALLGAEERLRPERPPAARARVAAAAATELPQQQASKPQLEEAQSFRPHSAPAIRRALAQQRQAIKVRAQKTCRRASARSPLRRRRTVGCARPSRLSLEHSPRAPATPWAARTGRPPRSPARWTTTTPEPAPGQERAPGPARAPGPERHRHRHGDRDRHGNWNGTGTGTGTQAMHAADVPDAPVTRRPSRVTSSRPRCLRPRRSGRARGADVSDVSAGVADLGGLTLGAVIRQHITLDSDAAGWGWDVTGDSGPAWTFSPWSATRSGTPSAWSTPRTVS